MNTTFKTLLLTSAACALIVGTAMAQSSGNSTGGSKVPAADAKFAREAAMGGKMEVDLGKEAVSKALSQKVKDFGQKMVDDHSKAGDELSALASKKGLAVPTDLDAKHKGMVDKYSGMTGAAFDKAYMRDMVRDHEQDIAEFQKEASSGSDSDLKAWASATLPTLQDHLRMAKDALAAVGGGTETSRK